MLFIAELTFVMELIAIALGLYFLYLAEKEKAKILKVGGYILLIGGILITIETVFFGVRWWVKGVPPTGYPKMGGHHSKVFMGEGPGQMMKYWCDQMEEKLDDCNEQACELLRPMLRMCDRFDD